MRALGISVYKKKIGLVAEMVVYEKLKTIYQNVNWVSKNCQVKFIRHIRVITRRGKTA